MNDDANLIQKRLRELDEDNKRLVEEEARIQKQRAENAREWDELVAAAKVIARLSGAERPSFIKEDAEPASEASGGKPEGSPPMPEMIFEALKASIGELEPKQMANYIADKWWPDVVVNNVASSAWRLWKSGKLEKVEGTSRYRLPQKNEAPDDDPSKNTSEASLFTPAEGREAGPGGGT